MQTLRTMVNQALGSLQKSGAQGASAQASTSQLREFNVDGGQFSLFRTTMEKHLSLTTLKDHRRGTVSGNDLSPQGIEAACAECMLSAQSAAPDPAWVLNEEAVQRTFTQGALQGDIDRLFARSKELLDTIGRDYPKIVVEQMIVAHRASQAAYGNSHGVQYDTWQGQYEVQLMFSGHEGSKSSSFNSAGIVCDNLDTPFIELGSVRQVLADAQKQIHTQAPQGKYEGTVVFTPDCLGSVLYSLLSNFASDGVLLDGTSPWKDRLGQPVADARISLSLNPLDGRIVCGERYTPEGFESANYDIIHEGVLSQFMLSAFVANKIGGRRAPNASFALVMQPGEQPLSQIIAGVERGILVGRFSGGSPSANGDFSGVAKNSFLIENGQITQAVSETMINGNLAAMLKQVQAISREVVEDGAMSLPWLAVGGITISGK